MFLIEFLIRDVPIICFLIRTSFHHMILVDSSVVHISNNARGNVAGIDTINVKTNDGAVRTLSNIYHVLELKCNLISLGALESKSSKHSDEGGVLKVSSGTQTLMKGLKHGNLYVFQGSTMMVSSSIISSLSSPNDIFTYKSLCKSHPSAKLKQSLNETGILGCLIAL